MDSMSQKLAAMKERFNKQKEESKKPGGGGTTLSQGRHACRLTDARLQDGDKGPYVRFEFTAIDGDEVGEKAMRIAGLNSDEQVTWLQRDLRRMGIDVDEMEITELPNKLKELVSQAPTVRLTVKQNGEFTNVYIDKMISTDESTSGGDLLGDSSQNSAASDPLGGRVGTSAEPDGEASETASEADNDQPDYGPGDPVSYKDSKGKKAVGIVRKIGNDGTVEIRDEKTKKVVKVQQADVELMAEPA